MNINPADHNVAVPYYTELRNFILSARAAGVSLELDMKGTVHVRHKGELSSADQTTLDLYIADGRLKRMLEIDGVRDGGTMNRHRR